MRMVMHIAFGVLLVAGLVSQRGDPCATGTGDGIFQVEFFYAVTGIPVRSHDGQRALFREGRSGSAVAVSPDGDLLTARHVVDLGYIKRELCLGFYFQTPLARESSEPMVALRTAQVIYISLVVKSSDGRVWNGAAVPVEEFSTFCDTGGRLRLRWDPTSTATIAAVDEATDLALVHILVPRTTFLQLQRTPPAVGTSAVAIGRYPQYERTTAGTVLEPCFMQERIFPDAAPMPMVRLSPMLSHGMSGGPVVAGGRIVGVSSRIGLVPPLASFAVPASYAAVWYDWARGTTSQRPVAQCP